MLASALPSVSRLDRRSRVKNEPPPLPLPREGDWVSFLNFEFCFLNSFPPSGGQEWGLFPFFNPVDDYLKGFWGKGFLYYRIVAGNARRAMLEEMVQFRH